ncbi:hypothetical protein GCM10027592_31970 [Spirosoma flavus]
MYTALIIHAGMSKVQLVQAFIEALDSRPVQEMHWDDKGCRELREKEKHRIWLENYMSLPKPKR